MEINGWFFYVRGDGLKDMLYMILHVFQHHVTLSWFTNRPRTGVSLQKDYSELVLSIYTILHATHRTNMNGTRQLVSQYSIRFAKEAPVSNLLRTTCLC